MSRSSSRSRSPDREGRALPARRSARSRSRSWNRRSRSRDPPQRRRVRSRSPAGRYPPRSGHYDYDYPPPQHPSSSYRYDHHQHSLDDRNRRPPPDYRMPPPPRGDYYDYPHPRGSGYEPMPQRDQHLDRAGPPRRGSSRDPPRQGQDRRDDGVSLLVRNIAPDVTVDDLRHIFGRIGRLRDVYIPKDYHTNSRKSFAFVEMANMDLAMDAKEELHRFLLKGREIEVLFAQERRKTPREMRGRSGASDKR